MIARHTERVYRQIDRGRGRIQFEFNRSFFFCLSDMLNPPKRQLQYIKKKTDARLEHVNVKGTLAS